VSEEQLPCRCLDDRREKEERSSGRYEKNVGLGQRPALAHELTNGDQREEWEHGQ
jgi:hypothetical protein